MNFAFNARKADVSEDVKEYAIKKFEKLDKFFNKDANALIKFREERGREIVEVTVQNDKLYFRAEDATSDKKASLDSVSDMIERQIRKNKTRLEKRLRSGAFEREPVASSPAVEEETTFDVVRRKRFDVKPMSLDEAILQMNLLNHQFFVFKNVDDADRWSIVYKRSDTGYGLIEAEN